MTGKTVGTLQLDGVTVLVIDDHLDSLELAELVLERAGANVLAAAGGEAALDFLDRHRVDVIVCDLSMPRLDGYELVRRIRERADEKHSIPALAISGSAAPQDVSRARRAGFDAHAAKPIAPESLVAHVVRVVVERRAATA